MNMTFSLMKSSVAAALANSILVTKKNEAPTLKDNKLKSKTFCTTQSKIQLYQLGVKFNIHLFNADT